MTDVGQRVTRPVYGLDIGATKVEAALVARDGTLRARSRISDADHHDDLITGIIELSRRHVRRIGRRRWCGMRRTDEPRGEEVSPLNIAQWRAFPLRRSLRDALGVDVTLTATLARSRWPKARSAPRATTPRICQWWSRPASVGAS